MANEGTKQNATNKAIHFFFSIDLATTYMLSPKKDLQSQCCKVESCPGMMRRQRILLTFDEKTTEETNSVGTYIGDASRDKNQDGKSMVVSGSRKRW